MREIFGRSGWRAAGKTVCFLVLLALALGWADRTLSFKDPWGAYNIKTFYEQKKCSVDLLVLGSSHAYINIDPGTLWDGYGVAAYDLGAGSQPLWSTYYYLREALKTQRPKLVVLDVFMAVELTEKSQAYTDAATAAWSILGMRHSGNRLEAVRLSTVPERRTSYFLGWGEYHNRTRYLTREDFLKNRGDVWYDSWKGSYLSRAVTACVWPEDIRTEERTPLEPKTEAHLRKIIELTQAEGIPLLLIVVPYPAVSSFAQSVYNTVSDIAAEYGVSFVDFNRDFAALEMDPAVEYYDAHHMNVLGSRKFTEKLGALLAERYGLPDRRGDPAYQSWEDNARYVEAYARDMQMSRGVFEDAPVEELLLGPAYTCAVAVSGGGTAQTALLESLGLPAGQEGLWLLSGGAVSWASGPEGREYFRLDGHDLKLSRTEQGNEIVYDGARQDLLADGVSIFVYDAVTRNFAALLTVSSP